MMKSDTNSLRNLFKKYEQKWKYSILADKNHLTEKHNTSNGNKLSELEQLEIMIQDSKSLQEERITPQGPGQRNCFDSICVLENLEFLQKRTNDIKCNFITSRRKDDLFKRLKKQQEERIMYLKKQAQRNFAFTLPNITKSQVTLTHGKQQDHFTLNTNDLQKLMPNTDLNDTIVGIYLKFIQFQMLDEKTSQSIHIFSSFLLQMLLGENTKDDFRELDSFQIQNIVEANFPKVKRWTRKFNIFDKKMIVIPINGWYHWNCVIVVNPKHIQKNSKGAYLVYCDSMYQKREMIVSAIRIYLRCLLHSQSQPSSKILPYLNEQNLPSYQLLLPRQTNAHDCGLYMLSFIELLLINQQQILCDLNKIDNRIKLHLFPRTLVFSMRDRLRKLLYRLVSSEFNNRDAIDEFKEERLIIFREANMNVDEIKLQDEYQDNQEFDTIDQRQFEKYEKFSVTDKDIDQQEEEYLYRVKIRFYLDLEINFYEKDK